MNDQFHACRYLHGSIVVGLTSPQPNHIAIGRRQVAVDLEITAAFDLGE